MTDQPETSPNDDRALIAEYLLGLLSPEEARTVEDRIAREEPLRAMHTDWAETMTTLLAGRDVTPPAKLRASIEARLFPDAAPTTSKSRWLGWLGIFAGPIAAFALAFFLLQPVSDFNPTLHAEMTAIDGSGAGDLHLAAGTDGTDLLIIRREGEAFPGRVLQLWMIVGDATPVSLGVLPDQERTVIPAPDGLASGVILAVSDEPVGGSPTGQPTGAVLVAGPLYDI